MAVMGLLAGNGKATGSAKFKGEELVGMKVDKLNKIRGSKMTMIFQDPMTSLTPHLKISQQLTEVLVLHKGMSERDARARGRADAGPGEDSRTPSAGSISIRTNFRAACASA